MPESDINTIIANNINKYLERSGRTQIELAEYMSVSQATISNWCKGLKMPRMDKIDRICNFFNIQRSDLMEESGENDKKDIITIKDQKDIAKRLDDTLEALKNPEGLMFDGDVLDDDTAELLRSSLENVLTTGKILAKKYTPKKYRKDS